MTYDVLILGGGAAGLAASRLLRRGGKRALIVEARGRLGGRMWTAEPGAAFAVELGAEYVHGQAELTQRLCRELGLTLLEVPDRHFERRGARWRPRERYWERLGRAFAKIPSGRDHSFAQAARETLRGGARAEAAAFVESFHGAPASDISALSLRATPEEFEETGRIRRVLGGYDRLVRALAREAGPARLRCLAQKIIWRRGAVQVVARAPQGRVTLLARRALITLPVGVLKQRAVVFEPRLREKEQGLELIGMGDALRCTARLDEPLRRAPPVSFWHDENAEWPVWWTPGPERNPLVTAWCGGPRAKRISEQGMDSARKSASENFARLTGIRGATFSGHDWTRDIFSRGAYSYARVNGKDAAKKFSRAVARTLFFGGEAAAPDGENATVEGALASGESCARNIF